MMEHEPDFAGAFVIVPLRQDGTSTGTCAAADATGAWVAGAADGLANALALRVKATANRAVRHMGFVQ